MLDRLKLTNQAMYDAVSTLIKQEQELQSLMGSFGGAAGSNTQQHQQHQQAQHPQRRLMAADTGSSGSSEGDGGLIEPFALGGSGSGGLAGAGSRQLKQDGAHHSAGAGGANAGAASGSAQAAAAGQAAHPGGTPGVESDPSHQGLTQEALDSFKVFDDALAGTGDDTAAAGAADAGATDPGVVAGGEAGSGGDGDAAGAADEGQVQPDVDEFGDAWAATQAALAEQQQQDQQAGTCSKREQGLGSCGAKAPRCWLIGTAQRLACCLIRSKFGSKLLLEVRISFYCALPPLGAWRRLLSLCCTNMAFPGNV